MRAAVATVSLGLAICGAVPVAHAHPSDPGVVSYAVLGRGSVGNIVGAPMGWESVFTEPYQGYSVDLPVCNNWADIGLPEVYGDPDLASFNGATTQTSATDQTHYVKQAVGVFARQRRRGSRLSPGHGSHGGLLGPDHRDASGYRDHTGVVVRRRTAERDRRELDQAGSGHRPALLRSNSAAGKRVAAGQGLPIWQRRSRGQRFGRGNAERVGPVVLIEYLADREYVGAICKMKWWRLSFR